MAADTNAVEVTEADLGTGVIDYNVTDAAIAEMRDNYKDLVISDKASYGKVVCAIRKVRETRVAVDKTRKKLKEKALEYGKRVDGEAKRITAELRAIEDPLKDKKQAVDDIEKREKEELQRVEKERVTNILAKMDVIEQLGNMLANMTAEQLADRIEELANTQIMEDVFEEYKDAAEIKKEQTLANLNDALVARQEAAKAEEERAAQAAIDKEIADKAAAEEEAQRKEEECVAKIASSITEFSDDLIGLSAESLIGRLAALESMEITEELFERYGEYPLSRVSHLFASHGEGFKTAKANTMSTLRNALADRQQRDRDEEELKASRAKLAEKEAAEKAEAERKEKEEQAAAEKAEHEATQKKWEESRPEREKLAKYSRDYLQAAINNAPKLEDARLYSIMQSILSGLIKSVDAVAQMTD